MTQATRTHVITLVLAAVVPTTLAIAAEPELADFDAGTPARASEANNNFNIVSNGIHDNQAQIRVLDAEIAALKAQLKRARN